VALLDQPSIEIAWQAEELLRWAAGEQAPENTIGSGKAAARKRCRAAWEAWYRRQGRQVDLGLPWKEYRRPGLFLLCSNWTERRQRKGQVWLCGGDGKPRWQVQGLPEAMDAHFLPGGRVLVAQWNPPRVTERDLDGKVLWEDGVGYRALACQRLPNGNTVVISQSKFAEATPGGKLASSGEFIFNQTGLADIFQKLPNGHFLGGWKQSGALVHIIEFDPATRREVKRVTLAKKLPVNQMYRVESLPSGHYLVSGSSAGLVEVDGAGKTVWAYPRAARGARLPNGNTVVGRPGRLLEIDPAGRTVWETFTRWGANRLEVCLGLVRLGFNGPPAVTIDLATSVPYRIKGLASKDAFVRRNAAYALRELGPKAVKAVPALIQRLDDEDEMVRLEAEEALIRIGPGGLPHLLKAAKDKRPRVRVGVVWVLGQFRSEGKKVVPALAEALKDKNIFVRQRAACVLSVVGPDAKMAIPALIAALKDREVGGNPRIASVSQCALSALANLGAEAKCAVPALLKIINSSKERDFRIFALYALGKIGRPEKEIVPVLLGLLKNNREDLLIRASAARALGGVGPKAHIAVPSLIKTLKVKDKNEPKSAAVLRAQAAWALGQIGSKDKATIPALLAMLQDNELGDEGDRYAAVEALGNIGPAAKSAIPALTRALKDKSYQIQQAAAQALKKIER
jgi:HEAT repeat protein